MQQSPYWPYTPVCFAASAGGWSCSGGSSRS